MACRRRAADRRRASPHRLGPRAGVDQDSARLHHRDAARMAPGRADQDTVMVVSELVANAIRHGTVRAQDAVVTAEAQVELSWCHQASRLICTVTDRSCKPPVLTAADFDAESGRGLQGVQALALPWGWTTPGS